MNILIIGYGIVGRNLHHEIEELSPHVYDKYKPANNSKLDNLLYDVAFVCVDTPYISKTNPCDITEVENAINDNNACIYVIKSTIMPGTTDLLIEKTRKKIIFSPEYYGSTHFTNNYMYDFTILGGDKQTCGRIIQILQNVYDCRHRFYVSDTKTAELVKYMENAFLAMKVSFCTQFWAIAQKVGIEYEALRELFIADPRINPSNTFVFADHPFWDSHCYNKDLAAISSEYDAPLIEAIIEFNEKMKTHTAGFAKTAP